MQVERKVGYQLFHSLKLLSLKLRLVKVCL